MIRTPALKMLAAVALLALSANSVLKKREQNSNVISDSIEHFSRALSGDDHEGHEAPHEWAGIFDTSENDYVWIAQKVEGDYADPGMKLVLISTETASKEALESVEEAGEEAIEGDCTAVTHGTTITPSADGTCYQLNFDSDRWESTFPIDATSAAAIAFFAEHVPTEFEEDTHYLKLVSTGEDIEPVAQEMPHGEEEEESKPWGKALGASILINLCTFIGLVFSVPFIANCLKAADPTFVYAAFASFAAGAILSCAFFLLLFESTHLIATGWDKETDHIWRWGTMILLGLILPSIVETCLGAIRPSEDAAPEGKEEFDDEEGNTSDETDAPTRSFSEQVRLIFAICFGDFMHNLCDGFFVGAAFKDCSDAMAWSITIATILHELPQELSDYLILTGPQVGLSTLWALVINFVTGLSVLLGAVIVLSVSVSDATTGLLLAFGGGIYLQIGAVECMPKMLNPKLSSGNKLYCILAFIIGTILIGLVLLDHEHCIAEGGHGHGHGH